MAKYLIKMKDNHVGEGLCNNESDLATIKIEDFYPGTTAYCITNKKTYILDEDKTGAVYNNINNNNNNQGEDSKKAIEIMIYSYDGYYGEDEDGEEDPNKGFRHQIAELYFTKNDDINGDDYYEKNGKENRDLLSTFTNGSAATNIQTFLNISPEDIIKIYGEGDFTYWYKDNNGEGKYIIKKPYVFIVNGENDEQEVAPIEVTYNIVPEYGWQKFTCEIPASEFFKSKLPRLAFTFSEEYMDV